MVTTISILSPVRNESAHVAEMIASIRSQSDQDWELVIVDDGSTDDTAAQCLTAATLDPRIQVVATSGIGKVAAFNLAYSMSRGAYICMVGGDDSYPHDSLTTRRGAMGHVDPVCHEVVVLTKLRTMSLTKSYDALVLPKGQFSSRSGGSVTMTRALAQRVFPVPSHLVSEDIWIGNAAVGIASRVVHSPRVALNYRVHVGNSNPRHKPFAEMSEAMANRHLAWRLLLKTDRFALSEQLARHLELLLRAEDLRLERRLVKLMLLRHLPLADRAAMAAMSTPALFRLRTRLNRLVSGRRGA